MTNPSMQTICKILGVDLYEVFAIKGRLHSGATKKGDEFLYFFTYNNLQGAMWPKDIATAVSTGYTYNCPIALDAFHALFSGMAIVVRAKPEKRKYILGHQPRSTSIAESDQPTLF